MVRDSGAAIVWAQILSFGVYLWVSAANLTENLNGHFYSKVGRNVGLPLNGLGLKALVITSSRELRPTT